MDQTRVGELIVECQGAFSGGRLCERLWCEPEILKTGETKSSGSGGRSTRKSLGAEREIVCGNLRGYDAIRSRVEHCSKKQSNRLVQGS